MSGETDLDVLLKTLNATLIEGLYVFATVGNDDERAYSLARMVFREAEGTTLILLQEQANELGLSYEFPCRMITLNIHSSLEAVGFMARITTVLAAHGMGVNPVAGFFHDHLFVPDGREQQAMQLLKQIAEGTL